MKVLSKIALSVTMLILLAFGISGIGFAKCNCSGNTSLVLPVEQGCCPTESDCMSVTVIHVSDYILQHNTDIPQPVMAIISLPFGVSDLQTITPSDCRKTTYSDHPPQPPTDIIGTVVLRV